MKTWIKSLVIFLVFFMGSTAVIHVDRQCAHMYGESVEIISSVENTIEKYVSLH